VRLPAISGTTDNSTRGATTACIPNYLNAFTPSMTSAPSINLTGTCLTPSPSGPFPTETQVANTLFATTAIVSAFENAGNGDGIFFTANQLCPARTTPNTFIANTAYVAGKVTEFFSTALRNTFKSTAHTWSGDNSFTYALSTLDNSTLGATCSYVTQNLNQSKNYLGAITFDEQPIVQQTTYPATVGELGYTRTFTGTKTSLSSGFNTLIDFGNIEIGNYIFSVKETVTCNNTTAGINFFNYFWGPSVAVAERNFSQFTSSGAWTIVPNILNHTARFNAGVTTFHRVFPVAFVNASTVVHSLRITGTFTQITSVRSDVTITKIA
jgi:hypothetical protein